MRPRPIVLLMASLVLAACNSASSRDEERAAAAVAHAQNAADVAAAEAAAQAATTSLLNLTQFTVVDQQGQEAGVFRNTSGAEWTGPDLVNGGEIAWTEVFRRDDQMVLTPAGTGTWDLHEVSIQLSGRVYVAYRAVGQDASARDYRATNLVSR